MVFSNEVIWKLKKNQVQIISTGGFLKEPPVQIIFLQAVS